MTIWKRKQVIRLDKGKLDQNKIKVTTFFLIVTTSILLSLPTQNWNWPPVDCPSITSRLLWIWMLHDNDEKLDLIFIKIKKLIVFTTIFWNRLIWCKIANVCPSGPKHLWSRIWIFIYLRPTIYQRFSIQMVTKISCKRMKI